MHPRVPARLAPTIFLACGLLLGTVGLQAQSGPPPGGPPGAGGRPPQALDPVVLEGPPEPGVFRDLARLDEPQATRYAGLYDNLMDVTRTERESLRQQREEMRRGIESGQRPPGAPRMEEMREMIQQLERRQRGFDEALKEMLSKEQYARYQDWRSGRRREAREQMRGPDREGRP